MNQGQLKQAMTQAAVDHVLPHLDNKSIADVGTDSTANSFIDTLARHKAEFNGTAANPEATAKCLKGHGILVYELNTVSELEFYVGGVDESNECLELVRSGGAVLTRGETVVATARAFICIADASRLVPILGQSLLPAEIIPVAHNHVTHQLMKLDGGPVYREGMLTDNDNIILDIHNLHIDSPVELEEKINATVGVVTNGLFVARPVDLSLPGTADGVRTLKA